ncbi:MAG: T9SS type A sorting domain-containing protein [Flavobacteriales bacterium]|nr:T9SS type A sorting domain-containing protein [Flavobacteriales bacterium]
MATVFNNEIWQYINQLTCTTDVADAPVRSSTLGAYPNPSADQVTVTLPANANWNDLRLTDALGREVLVRRNGAVLDLTTLPSGTYTLSLRARP